ncbi:hypothetical protein KP509_18G069100 [Ceratopteris richardii]|uniref:Uncharacterized protein n=1 Tax=Ceratopteris richardii TaxID=49495 RepID=A0A8T2SQI3_CERRI|nr:hypothetical protein KP509_18G069100 [Ceratopteris richardii]
MCSIAALRSLEIRGIISPRKVRKAARENTRTRIVWVVVPQSFLNGEHKEVVGHCRYLYPGRYFRKLSIPKDDIIGVEENEVQLLWEAAEEVCGRSASGWKRAFIG